MNHTTYDVAIKPAQQLPLTRHVCKHFPPIFIAIHTLCLLACGITAPAHAESAISYHLGTFDFGVDYNHRLSDTMTARLGYNLYAMGRASDSDGVQYDAKLKIATASVLLDLHHAGSPWRLTLGLS